MCPQFDAFTQPIPSEELESWADVAGGGMRLASEYRGLREQTALLFPLTNNI